MEPDIPYRLSPEAEEKYKQSMKYYEPDSLYRKLLASINESNLNEISKLICLFSIHAQWLERGLNDFYDNIMIASGRPNPLVYRGEYTAKQSKSFRASKEEMKSFADLTLGLKLSALTLFHYRESDEEKRYQSYLDELRAYKEPRNRVVHHMFSQKIGSSEKIEEIGVTLARLLALIKITEQRNSQLAQYLLNNLSSYYDLSGNYTEEGEER